MAQQTEAFQTEVQEILNLMIHSLYSHKEIFLRELISNASDALDKLRFQALTQPDLKFDKEALEIRLIPDQERRTLKICDNGIGMNLEEVRHNIGTIAHSGTKSFLKTQEALQENPELIGQFGVGFYSAFMVADKVTLHTQKAGESQGVLWESRGDGTYTIDEVPRPEGQGTTVTLHLKKFEEEDAPGDFTDSWLIRSLVKKYSDFIAYPIRMKVKQREPMRDSEGKVIDGKYQETEKDETLNSQKAIWLRSPQEINEEEYQEFYKHISHDWGKPLQTIHYKAEGLQEFTSLLFLPEQRPFDFHTREYKHGLQLYVRRVFIMSGCEELLPPYLRFMKGVVDSSDLSLNVSREILQQDRQVAGIRKALVNRVLKALAELQEKDTAKYKTFWQNFGSTLKEGLTLDPGNKEKLRELLWFRTTASDDWTSLKEYVARMKPAQKEIYYIAGESLDRLRNSPYLERLKEKEYEVLFLVDPIDEWVVQTLTEYQGKRLRSITAEGLDLDTEEEKKNREEKRKQSEEKYKPLAERIQGALKEKVKEVRLSDRLVDTPACLVSGAYDPSANLERIMKALGQDAPKSQRILEINPEHPVFDSMKELDEARLKDWAEILYNQALLNEGSALEDPRKFSQQIAKLMVDAAK